MSRERAPRPERWLQETYEPARARHGERREAFETSSGIPLEPLYTDDPEAEGPGEFPFTRGLHPSLYRSRLWTMRQYAGFSSPAETNERFRFLLEKGQTGLSTAFDLPTQIGYDSDDPEAVGEVGRVGVPISTLDDLDDLLAGIPLEKVSISMTINSTAAVLLAFLVALAKRRGIDPAVLRGTVQNDILKEFIARGTQRFPVEPSLRLAVDVIEYAAEHLPSFYPISISGYHIREAGSTAVEEVAFTLADGIAYLEACRERGLDLVQVGRRLSFFFNAHNHFFEEVAKFRAARRLWATICRERFGIEDDRACQLRFHTQTGGSTLTAQEPDNNVVRVTVQALAAVLGGTQSLHTNSADEALSLPSESAAQVALRTQQILARESGVTEVVDPLGGSPYVESLTADVEEGARAIIAEIDERGGTVAAIADGFIRRRIESSAYHAQVAIDSGEATPVGVSEDAEIPDAPFSVDPAIEVARLERIGAFRATRDDADVAAARETIGRIAVEGGNLVPALVDAVERKVTIGEIARTLAEHFGEFQTMPEHRTGPIRVLLAKPGLDGHDRGIRLVLRALRDAGMEVIYTGLRATPAAIVRAALEEDVEAIGLSSLSGAHLQHFTAVGEQLEREGAGDVLLFGGGIIPKKDVEALHEAGFSMIYPPGTPLDTIVVELRKKLRPDEGGSA